MRLLLQCDIYILSPKKIWNVRHIKRKYQQTISCFIQFRERASQRQLSKFPRWAMMRKLIVTSKTHCLLLIGFTIIMVRERFTTRDILACFPPKKNLSFAINLASSECLPAATHKKMKKKCDEKRLSFSCTHVHTSLPWIIISIQTSISTLLICC